MKTNREKAESGLESEAPESFYTDAALFFLGWRRFVALPDKILQRRQLGRVHHRILFAVGRTPGVHVGGLCGALGISRQALNRPLRELQQAGLVESRRSAKSGRKRELFLTPAGQELEGELSGVQRALLREVFEQAGPEATAGWRQVMSALAAPAVQKIPELNHFFNDPSKRRDVEPNLD